MGKKREVTPEELTAEDLVFAALRAAKFLDAHGHALNLSGFVALDDLQQAALQYKAVRGE